MIFLPKCRALCVYLEKGHGAGKKGMALEKKGMARAIVKVARGNTTFVCFLSTKVIFILFQQAH